jgi:GNAT superfamily N-acetyltransferase
MEKRSHRLTLQRKPLAMVKLLIAAPRPVEPALQALLGRKRRIAIAPLTAADRAEDFSCGTEELDNALRRDIAKAPHTAPFACYAARIDGRIVGFYRLRKSRIDCVYSDSEETDASVTPLPLVEMPRLAVDRHWQGKGLGAALFADALRRAVDAGAAAGASALYIHALSEDVKPFYVKHGLRKMPEMIDRLGFIVTLQDIANAERPLDGRTS